MCIWMLFSFSSLLAVSSPTFTPIAKQIMEAITPAYATTMVKIKSIVILYQYTE